jgi:putative heme iron utilization protein
MCRLNIYAKSPLQIINLSSITNVDRKFMLGHRCKLKFNTKSPSQTAKLSLVSVANRKFIPNQRFKFDFPSSLVTLSKHLLPSGAHFKEK